jgi:hypothetical protein
MGRGKGKKQGKPLKNELACLHKEVNDCADGNEHSVKGKVNCG